MIEKRAFFEMSRYIDLDLYHEVERSHPFYREMTAEICSQIEQFGQPDRMWRILEIGAGTGLLTEELLKFPFMDVYAVEIDTECFNMLKNRFQNDRFHAIQNNAITYCQDGFFDIVVSSFAHDHIHYDNCVTLAKNIKRNLNNGGIYIMGGEFLPFFETDEERIESLCQYHCFIVEKSLRDRNFRVAQIEINALKSGVEMIGDFKRHVVMFEQEMAEGGLKLSTKKKIGPLNREDVGGVFVYVYKS